MSVTEDEIEAAARKMAGQSMIDDGYGEHSRVTAERGEMWRNFRAMAIVALEAAARVRANANQTGGDGE